MKNIKLRFILILSLILSSYTAISKAQNHADVSISLYENEDGAGNNYFDLKVTNISNELICIKNFYGIESTLGIITLDENDNKLTSRLISITDKNTKYIKAGDYFSDRFPIDLGPPNKLTELKSKTKKIEVYLSIVIIIFANDMADEMIKQKMIFHKTPEHVFIKEIID